MPFIQTKTNLTITREKEEALKDRFGKAISCIPGKTENWLMLDFEDGRNLYFQGSGDRDLAILDVKLYGSAGREDYEKLTGELTKILQEELGIQPDGIYITYEEIREWGWNGGNF